MAFFFFFSFFMDSPSFRLRLRASIKQKKITVAHTTCRYYSVRFYALVRQPFLRWLFTLSPPQRPICVTSRLGREKRKRAHISLEGGPVGGTRIVGAPTIIGAARFVRHNKQGDEDHTESLEKKDLWSKIMAVCKCFKKHWLISLLSSVVQDVYR